MGSMWMICLAILAVGGLICFRGLSLYKLVQFLVCGWAGAYLAVWAFGKMDLGGAAIAALIVGLITGFLGFHFYKVGMYFTASISAYLVVFSFFWRQAMETGKMLMEQVTGVEEMFSVSNLLQIGLSGLKGGNNAGILDTILLNAGIQPALWTSELEQIMSYIRQGIIWAGIAGLLAGILALTVGDYVIILLTAVFGGMLLNLLVEMFIPMSQTVSILLLAGFSLIGIVMQMKRKKEAR